MTTYQCDCCGRQCSRIHCGVAYGTDTAACDDCAGYEWEAYGEEHDPLLAPKGHRPMTPRELRAWWRLSARSNAA